MVNDIRSCELIEVDVTSRGRWLFVALVASDGLRGYGEASHTGDDEMTKWILRERLVPTLSGIDPMTEDRKLLKKLRRFKQDRLVESFETLTAISAIEQAITDLKARRIGQPLSVLLGGPLDSSVPLYANINRALIADRSPEAFAAVARSALDSGFRAVKCAPFDGIRLRQDRSEWREKMNTALRRVHEVRQTIGKDVDLMIDCHGRFSSHDAIWVSNELEDFDVYWFEDPIWPDTDLEDMRQIRRRTNVRLAGGEFARDIRGVKDLISGRLVDIILPDVKHCGVEGLKRIADHARLFGVDVAPHSPSGPISTAFSAHLCSVIENMHSLEFAFDEVPWRRDMVSPSEPILQGHYHVQPDPGLGLEFAPEAEERLVRTPVDV